MAIFLPGETYLEVCATITEKFKASELHDSHVLRSFSNSQLNPLARDVTVLQVRKGEVIYRPGPPTENLYIIIDGEVGLSLLGSKGSFLRLAVLSSRRVFWRRRAGSRWRQVSHAGAFSHSRIGAIPARKFVEGVCSLPWKVFTALTEMTLKPLLLVSLRRALYFVEDLPNRVGTTLWEYASRPEARKKAAFSLCP
jgi:hypothetical protein